MTTRLRFNFLCALLVLTFLAPRVVFAQDATVQFDIGRFLQGTGNREINDSATSSNGIVAICGVTIASDFATPGAVFETLNVDLASGIARADAFVALYDEETLQLLAATYLGGTDYDRCYSVSFGPDGSVVVVGSTNSDDFPVSNEFDSTLNGDSDGFVASFTADLGSLNFATYVGGTDGFFDELLTGVTVSSDGTIHTTGISSSSDLPATELFENRSCASPNNGFHTDLLYARLASDGSLLNLYCLGGDAGRSAGYKVIAGAQDKVYLSGRTDAVDFPFPDSTVDLAANSSNGRYVFVLELDNATGTLDHGALVAARLDNFAFLTEMELTGTGELVLVGGGNVPGIVPTANAIKGQLTESEDSTPEFVDYYGAGFIIRLNENVDSVQYASYFGGDISDQYISDVAVDAADQVWVSAAANDRSLPVLNSVVSTIGILSSEIQLPPETAGARDFKIALQPINPSFSNGLLAQSGQNYGVGYPSDLTLFTTPQPIGPTTGDTRAIALQRLDATGRGVMVNYDGVNIAFDNGFSVGQLTFGENNEKSTHAAIGGDQILVANDGQPNKIYAWSFNNTITETGTFGSTDDDIVDIDHIDGSDIFITAQTPDRLSLYSAFDGNLQDEVTLNGFIINEMRLQNYFSTDLILVSNANGASELLVMGFDDSLSDAQRIVIDPDLPGIKSMIIGFSTELILLAATEDTIHVYSLDPSNDWQMSKIDESATTATDPRFGENRLGDFRDVVPIANANGNATYHHVSFTDLYVAAVDTVNGQQLTGTYLGGAGRDDCFCPIATTSLGNVIFAPNTHANEFTGIQGSDEGIGQKAGLVRLKLVSNALDTDLDGVPDSLDNCTVTANANQVDTDADGFGNACDGDFNQDQITNFLDLSIFSGQFLSTGPSVTDMNGDGVTNFVDLALFSEVFLQPPGPSGVD